MVDTNPGRIMIVSVVLLPLLSVIVILYCVASERSFGKIPCIHHISLLLAGSQMIMIFKFHGIIPPSYIHGHTTDIILLLLAMILDSLIITGLIGRAIPLRSISPILDVTDPSRSPVFGLYCTHEKMISPIFSLHPVFVRVQFAVRFVFNWRPQSSHT